MKQKDQQLKRKRLLRAGGASREKGGYTLIEATISLLLMSLLLLGTIDLFINAMRNSSDENALIFANLDAANALQAVVESTREAYYFQLPDDVPPSGQLAFEPQAGQTAGSYEATMTVGSQTATVCTGMMVTFPPTVATTSVNFDDGSTHSVTGLYDRYPSANTTTGTQVLYYRSDPDGTADADAGTCLWAYSMSDNGATINKALIKSIAPALPNAVQFVRPQSVPNAQGTTTSIPYEVEIKVVCSYYAPTGGAATNEVSDKQATTSLDGKCVFMRDHEIGTTYENGSTSPVNNQFTQ
jgi:type II secretory pathway pseudopilin PulG